MTNNSDGKDKKDSKPTAESTKSSKPTAESKTQEISLRPQQPMTKEQKALALAQAKGKAKVKAEGSSTKKIKPGMGTFDAGNVPTMMFEQIALPMYQTGDPKKFRNIFKLDQQQECLVDNLWDTGSAKHKVAALNALSYYFTKIQAKPFCKSFHTM